MLGEMLGAIDVDFDVVSTQTVTAFRKNFVESITTMSYFVLHHRIFVARVARHTVTSVRRRPLRSIPET